MLELEVYAAGVCDLNKALELDDELAVIGGFRCKVDRKDEIVYLESDEPRFVGVVPRRTRAKSETQLLTI